jgi:hypothetical protein
VHGASASSGVLGQTLEIEAPIHVGEEAWQAVDAALNDVERETGELEPRMAGHAGTTRGVGDPWTADSE